jgi:ABC-type antimicrobial peptide transport system permease subunit
MADNKTSQNAGLGLGTVLFVMFLVLKLTDNIDWSWWWVFSPIWIPLLLLVLILITAVIAATIAKKKL